VNLPYVLLFSSRASSLIAFPPRSMSLPVLSMVFQAASGAQRQATNIVHDRPERMLLIIK